MAGEPGSRSWVRVLPPLSAIGPSPRSATDCWSDPAVNPQLVPLSRLPPLLVMTAAPSRAQSAPLSCAPTIALPASSTGSERSWVSWIPPLPLPATVTLLSFSVAISGAIPAPAR